MKKMTFYSKRTKKNLRDDIQDGLDTLALCRAHLITSDSSFEYEDEKELLLEEYQTLSTLKKRLDYCIYYDEDMEINTDDYLLVTRWHYTDFYSFCKNFNIDVSE